MANSALHQGLSDGEWVPQLFAMVPCCLDFQHNEAAFDTNLRAAWTTPLRNLLSVPVLLLQHMVCTECPEGLHILLSHKTTTDQDSPDTILDQGSELQLQSSGCLLHDR